MRLLASIILVGILTSACTNTITEYKLITPDIQIVQRPEKPKIKNVHFDQENNLITLTLKSYENLVSNLTEILKQTKNLENVIDYYEESIKAMNSSE